LACGSGAIVVHAAALVNAGSTLVKVALAE